MAETTGDCLRPHMEALELRQSRTAASDRQPFSAFRSDRHPRTRSCPRGSTDSNRPILSRMDVPSLWAIEVTENGGDVFPDAAGHYLRGCVELRPEVKSLHGIAQIIAVTALERLYRRGSNRLFESLERHALLLRARDDLDQFLEIRPHLTSPLAAF